MYTTIPDERNNNETDVALARKFTRRYVHWVVDAVSSRSLLYVSYKVGLNRIHSSIKYIIRASFILQFNQPCPRVEYGYEILCQIVLFRCAPMICEQRPRFTWLMCRPLVNFYKNTYRINAY